MTPQLSSKLKGVLWILSALAMVWGFWIGGPFLINQFPWALEQRLGRSFKLVPDSLICNHPSGTQALSLILKRLVATDLEQKAEPFPVEVAVIRGEEVNAFAVLGGKIYLYQALIKAASSPEEIAGVIAHEIEHVHHRHILNGLSHRFFMMAMMGEVNQALDLMMGLKFSRNQEHQADHDGFRRLKNARISPVGFIDFFDRLSRESSAPEILSDHPDSKSRADLGRQFVVMDPEPVLNTVQWESLKKICTP